MMTSVFFTGCKKETQSSEGPTTQTASNEPQTTNETKTENGEADLKEETKEFVKLTWYMIPCIVDRPNEKNVMAEINRQLKEKINAELEFHFIDLGSYEEKMRVMSAAGDPYDICLATSWINKINLNVARGAFAPLNDLLPKYGPNILRIIEDRWWPAVTYNGKIYAIPNPSNYAQAWGFVFKKDLVEKYNFDYKNCHTLDDLEPYLEIIKKNEPDIIPLCASPKYTPGLDVTLELDHVVANIYFDPQTNKFTPIYDVPRMIAKYKKISEYYKKGYIAKDAATLADWKEEGKTGRYAVMSTTGSFTEDGSKSSAEYGFPCVESFIGTTLVSTTSVTSAAIAVSATSRNPERAVMLIDLMYGDKKFLNLCAFGIEGQDYRVVDGQGTDNPTIEVNSPYTWVIWANWLGDLYQSYPCINGNTAEALAQMKKDIEMSQASPILGFIFDIEPVKNEVAQLETINTEFSEILITGTHPDVDAYLSEFRARSEAAGIGKVMAEIERQYNAWKEANKK